MQCETQSFILQNSLLCQGTPNISSWPQLSFVHRGGGRVGVKEYRRSSGVNTLRVPLIYSSGLAQFGGVARGQDLFTSSRNLWPLQPSSHAPQRKHRSSWSRGASNQRCARLREGIEAKNYIHFRTMDFKGLSTVATVPDHQSNKTCAGKVFDTRDDCSTRGQKIMSEIQCITFLLPPPKRTSYPSIGLAYEPIPCCSSCQIWLATRYNT